MTMTARRQELKNCIDIMADDSIFVVEPILSLLAKMNAHSLHTDYVIETDLTDEEKKIIMDGVKEYEEHPESFARMEDVNWG